MKPKFVHLRAGGMAVTVAYTLDEPTGVYTCGFAYCSKLDTFNKAKGRLIAEGRYFKDSSRVSGRLDTKEGKLDSLPQAIMSHWEFCGIIYTIMLSKAHQVEQSLRLPRWLPEFVDAWQRGAWNE